MSFSIVYKKLIFKGIKRAFRIRCIMLILGIIKNQLLKMVSIVVVTLLAFVFQVQQ